LFNLKSERAENLAKTDAIWLSRLFDRVTIGNSAVPRCDVLFLYVDITANGTIAGSPLGLREIVRDSGAKIVVVASENPPESYIKAGRQRPYGRANLVMTLDRCGTAFGGFLSGLFSKMQSGESMDEAWVQLHPQVPGLALNVPETIFACELGPVAFSERV
jgi:hypothetical protein